MAMNEETPSRRVKRGFSEAGLMSMPEPPAKQARLTTPREGEEPTEAEASQTEAGCHAPEGPLLTDLHLKVEKVRERRDALCRQLLGKQPGPALESIGEEIRMAETAATFASAAADDGGGGGGMEAAEEKLSALLQQVRGAWDGESAGGQPLAYRFPGLTAVGLAGGRVGLHFDAPAGGSGDHFCVVATDGSSEQLHVAAHSLPFFIPLPTSPSGRLRTRPAAFVEAVRASLDAFAQRQHQLQEAVQQGAAYLASESHTKDFSHVELDLAEASCKVSVTLVYEESTQVLPSHTSAVAFLLTPEAVARVGVARGSRSGGPKARAQPHRLRTAEEALRSLPLPQALPRVMEAVRILCNPPPAGPSSRRQPQKARTRPAARDASLHGAAEAPGVVAASLATGAPLENLSATVPPQEHPPGSAARDADGSQPSVERGNDSLPAEPTGGSASQHEAAITPPEEPAEATQQTCPEVGVSPSEEPMASTQVGGGNDTAPSEHPTASTEVQELRDAPASTAEPEGEAGKQERIEEATIIAQVTQPHVST